ncbi:2-hydroxy-3-keto-5-methylthiopentenyl-1-phosphate phosphatase [Halalkalibacter urbisdiaboli]|uniref:2-hydroxy-3-keto-5-methylthiopentenyl-1- phosphate phosphatase n=1 Tax=Halalkalibacter urbisdiaboli TaxID=1960589 RepID=UPI000B434EB0|nr:2-hydroxy-3-keto-5-methylthiopentenyl-1-phosphate phosphatase [Halalkalibacter urbisdiaboli]
MKQPVIFCDFDGTITNNDNIIVLMKRFAPPEWEAIKDDILGQKVTIQEGVSHLFSLLSTELKQDLISFLLETAEIRDGFREILLFTGERNIEFYVVSGGIDFFIYPLLEPFAILNNHIYCNGSDFSGETITITWPNSCDEQCHNGCGCCKPSIMRRFPAEEYERIVIGDSITDLQAAKQADIVYARDFLIEKCEELSIAYTPFTSFHDVITDLKNRGVKG